MRRLAVLPPSRGPSQRVIIHSTPCGTFVFGRAAPDDGPCDADHWFEHATQAEEFCGQTYGVRPEDWREIPEPPDGCQQDWVSPVRRTTQAGAPSQVVFERREADGVWRPVPPISRGAG